MNKKVTHLMFIVTLSLIFVCVQSTSHDDLDTVNRNGKYGHLESVMKDLQNQEWDTDETQCRLLLLKVMKNVQNSTIWATWIWDSMQNPVGQLYGSRYNYGNYDQCVDFPWEKLDPDMRTQYCLAHIDLAEVDLEYDEIDFFGNMSNYIQAKTKHHLKFNTLKWGVCTPAACQPHAVAKFVNVMFGQTHLGLAVDKPNITVEYCDLAGSDKFVFDLGFFLTALLAAFVILYALFATWIVSQRGPEKTSDYFKAFHIPTNARSLLTITNNDVKSLFGIRVISTVIMILLHVWALMRSKGVINAIRINKHFDILSALFPVEMTVETFLLMSGLLLVKGLLRNGSHVFNPLMIIIKRYIRTIWLLLVTAVIFTNLLKNFSRGPAMYEEYDKEIDKCKKNLWRSLLMIQNYGDNHNMCNAVSWSIALDFHLSVIGTLICWLFLRNKRTGLIVFITSFIASILAPAVFVYYREQILLCLDFRVSDNIYEYVVSNELHSATHLRAGGYFVGMAVGYIMFKYNPVTHRNVISKKLSLLGLFVFLVMLLGIFSASTLMVNRGYSITGAILYASLKRVVWATAFGILIIVCEYGDLPLVTGFLSWSAWAPIGILSYGIYLIHGVYILYFAGIKRSPPHCDFISVISDTVGVTVFSAISSLVMWLFIGAPLNNILILIFRNRNKNASQGVERIDKSKNLANNSETTNKKIL